MEVVGCSTRMRDIGIWAVFTVVPKVVAELLFGSPGVCPRFVEKNVLQLMWIINMSSKIASVCMSFFPFNLHYFRSHCSKSVEFYYFIC